jgi:ribonuclease D
MQSRATVLHVTSVTVGDYATHFYIVIKCDAIANIVGEIRCVVTVLSFALDGTVRQGASMSVYLHEEDLPAGVLAEGPVAVDTETMGLITPRDRLCLLQISDGRGDEHLIRFSRDSDYKAPNLRAVLADPARLKLFHYARFDLAAISHYLNVVATPLFCTKIASRLTRTYTDRHGLKELVKEILSTDISKQQQSSDWGGPVLSEAQKDYAASDVRYLHRLHAEFVIRLEREGRTALAQACFDFLPHRAGLDLAGWPEIDIFGHS